MWRHKPGYLPHFQAAHTPKHPNGCPMARTTGRGRFTEMRLPQISIAHIFRNYCGLVHLQDRGPIICRRSGVVAVMTGNFQRPGSLSWASLAPGIIGAVVVRS